MKPNPPVPLPIHFKLPGRSYSQIGRKGNIALYSVYSDYIIVPDFATPYLLIGYELIAIKVWKGRETYPNDSEFGSRAWSIPKSLPRVCSPCTRRRVFGMPQFSVSQSKTFPYRSSSSGPSAHLAQRASQKDKTAAKCSEIGTYKAQRRVSLRERLITNQPTSRWPGGAGVGGAKAGGSPTGQAPT
jgi:hypothetical protein